MSAQASAEDRARQEAADWFARLNSRTISTEALKDFRVWRGDAVHAQAYAEIETLWKAAKRLEGDAEVQAAVQAALQPRRRGIGAWAGDRHQKRAIGAVGLAAALLAVGLLLRQDSHTYRAGIGEQRIVRLDDGTRVRLDTDTELTVRFAKDARRVELARGQAFFDVAHDAGRPFTVRADGTEVRALGTRFDVRRDAGSVQVTLVEGRVQVRQTEGHGRWILDPGQQLRVSPRAVPVPVQRIDVAAATSWTSGRLTFQQTPLTAAIAEVNRYGRRKLVLQAPDLAARQVNGVFDTGDTEAFASAVADLYGLKVDAPAQGPIVLRRPGPAGG